MSDPIPHQTVFREAIEAFLAADEDDRLVGYVTSWLLVSEVSRPGGAMVVALRSGDGSDDGKTGAWRVSGLLDYASRVIDREYEPSDEDDDE